MRSLPLLALLAACGGDKGSHTVIEPSFIQVLLSGELATEDAPLAFTAEDVTWSAQVSTMDRNGDPYAFEGDLKVRAVPGVVKMDPWVSVTGGQWSGDVSFRGGFGPTRIWFSDEGDKDSSSTRSPSFGAGVSDPIWYTSPTIAEMQRTDDHTTDQLANTFVDFRVADRQVVVTVLGTNGFWVVDLADALGDYSGLFIYTFNEPRDLVVGDRLTLLTGVNQEYLATTQVSFPTYEVAEDESLTPPDPVPLSSDMACDDDVMEGLESTLVEATDVAIPSSFVEGSEDYTDYLEYGQWPFSFAGGDCTIYASSSTTVPDFLPTEHVGETLPVLRGLVSEIWGKWVLVVPSAESLGLSDDSPAATRPSLPRARPAPKKR